MRFSVTLAVLASSTWLACSPGPAAESTARAKPGTAAPWVHPAMDSLDSLEPSLRAAFADAPEFRAFDPGDEGDWVANFGDQSRTVGQFAVSARNVPDGQRKTIYVQPLGDFDGPHTPTLSVLADYLEAYYSLEVKLLDPIELELDRVGHRRRETGRQLLTGDLLTWLGERLPDDAYCLLGITMTDLYPGDDWNYVFGEATFGERVGVYSFARYDPGFWGQPFEENSRQSMLERSMKVMTHETGHMLGMHHCTHYACNMNGSNNLEEADRQPLSLCPVCLRKLHVATSVDPEQRYRSLAVFYGAHGFDDELAWTRTRLATIEARGSLPLE